MAKLSIPTLPLDDFARDGRFHAVTNGEHFAVARWRDAAWEFANGEPIGFVPVGYYAQVGQ